MGYEQLDIFSFLRKEKIFNPGDYVEKDSVGKQLTFNEIVNEVGNLIIMDKSTRSHEWYEIVRVERIVTVEDNHRRLVYYDGTRQNGLVDEIYFDEKRIYPARAYRIAD